jgi:hypothetical protein
MSPGRPLIVGRPGGLPALRLLVTTHLGRKEGRVRSDGPSR